MLHHRQADRPLSRRGRAAVLAALAVVALAASAVRGPAQKPSPGADAPAGAGAEPFDLTWVRPGAKGVYGFRPSVILRDLPAQADEYRQAAEAVLTEGFGLPKGRVKITDIEQVVGEVVIKSDGSGKPGSRSLMCSLSSVRVREGFDLAGLLAAIKGVTVKEEGGKRYYVLPKNPVLGPTELVLYLPDARTAVVADRKMIEDGPPAARDGGDDWKRVERCAAAIQLDPKEMSLSEELAGEEKELQALASAAKHMTRLTAGLAATDDGLAVTVLVRASDEAGPAAQMAASCGELIALAKKAIALRREADPGAIEVRCAADLLKNDRVERKGALIQWNGSSAVTLMELLARKLEQ
jgi:hypothetical protein